MDEATIAAIADEAFDRLDAKQQIAVRIAEEIKRDAGASEATMQAASAMFTPEELVELVLAAGFYIMTAGFLLSYGIEVEATAPLGERHP